MPANVLTVQKAKKMKRPTLSIPKVTNLLTFKQIGLQMVIIVVTDEWAVNRAYKWQAYDDVDRKLSSHQCININVTHAGSSLAEPSLSRRFLPKGEVFDAGRRCGDEVGAL